MLAVICVCVVVFQVENDDGIWLKLSKESAKKFCESESEAWTLAVGPSGRIFLSKEGDYSYLSQVVDSSAKAAKPSLFPTAAAVFGTSNQSVFGTPLSDIPAVFQFSSGKPVKLQFGGGKPTEKFEFKAAATPFKFGSKVKKPSEESEKQEKQGKQESLPEKPAFNIGISGAPRGAVIIGRRVRRRSRNSPPVEDQKKADKDGENEEDEEKKTVESKKQEKEKSSDDLAKSPKIMSVVSPTKQALSPAMAECQRAVYAAFLWQEGLVHDAIASATYLKFHPELSKEHSQDLIKQKKEREKEADFAATNEEEMKDRAGEEKSQGKEEATEEPKEDEKQAVVKEKPSASASVEPKLANKNGLVLLQHSTIWSPFGMKSQQKLSSVPLKLFQLPRCLPWRRSCRNATKKKKRR